jgi:hypothetical protein
VVLLPTPMSPIQAHEKHQQPPTNEHYTKYPPVTLKTVKGKKKKTKKRTVKGHENKERRQMERDTFTLI